MDFSLNYIRFLSVFCYRKLTCGDSMLINPQLRVGPIPLHHKCCHDSKNSVIRGVSALVYEDESSGSRNEHLIEI